MDLELATLYDVAEELAQRPLSFILFTKETDFVGNENLWFSNDQNVDCLINNLEILLEKAKEIRDVS